MDRRETPAAAEEVIMEMASTCVLMRSRLISRVITGIHDEALRAFGIGSAQFVLLVVIFRLQPATRAAIGRYHHQDRSTLTRNLKLILAEGWAEEVQGEDGGRGRPIVLTKAGKDLLVKASPTWRLAQGKATALLGEEGVTVVTDVANGIIEGASAA